MPPSKGFARTGSFGTEDRIRIMQEILRAELSPERAPYSYQTDAMAEFLANVRVGETKPAGVTGSIRH